jgi:predicted transcriptional regulator
VLSAVALTLPPGQQRVLEALDAYVAEHHYPPTDADLAQRLGCSRTLIAKQVKALMAKGLVVRDYATPRSLRRVSVSTQ